MKEREIPAIIYSTLKLYGAIRSKTLSYHFFSFGLCLSYNGGYKISKNCQTHKIKNCKNANVFAPSPLTRNLFTVLAKDNIDFHATSFTSGQYLHGTSMTATAWKVS